LNDQHSGICLLMRFTFAFASREGFAFADDKKVAAYRGAEAASLIGAQVDRAIVADPCKRSAHHRLIQHDYTFVACKRFGECRFHGTRTVIWFRGGKSDERDSDRYRL